MDERDWFGNGGVDDTADVEWDAVFADLEDEFAGRQALELADEVADRTRREVAQVSLRQRLAASAGSELMLTLQGGARLTGRVERSGVDWTVLVDATGLRALVALAAVVTVTGLPTSALPDPPETSGAGVIARRTTYAYLLRALARDRAPATLLLVDGARLTGTVDRVGADFVDLAEHDLAEVRRPGAVVERRTLTLAAVAAVLAR